MKKYTLPFVLLLLILASCKKEEKARNELKLGDFILSQEKLSPGDSATITYNGQADDMEALYYQIVGPEAYPYDLNFGEDNIVTIKIPDSIQALAFNFNIDGEYDNNDKKGYLMPLYNENGEALAGSRSALASYSMFQGRQFGIEVEVDSIIGMLKKDYETYPEVRSTYRPLYFNLLYRNDKNDNIINSYIDSFLAKDEISEEEYGEFLSTLSLVDKRELADSISKVAIDKFPDGKIAKGSYSNRFYGEGDFDKKVAIFEEYSSRYSDMGNVGDYMIQTLARGYYDKGDLDKFTEYADKLKTKQAKASLYNNIAWPLAEKGENLDFAAKISKESVDLMQSLKDNPEDKPTYYSENQYKESIKESYNMFADTYALILFKQGKVKEALSYQERIYDKGQTAEVNERYIDYLIADKQYDVAMEKAANFIKNAQATEKIKKNYKTAFSKVNLDGGDVGAALKKLEVEGRQKQIAEMKKDMVDEPSTDFTLKDTEGKEVTLSDLKGKTVILDFWATWCGPCKASFPGMQQVVEKYKDDENVKLLFIDTFEKGETREKLVTDFIKENNYDFHVVYDNEIENSNDFEVAKKYGIKGIPTKVIIGPDGNIKYKSVGFGGSNDKLINELDILIELLKG